MSSASRRKKRSKRKAKQSQKLAWMVELRLMGHSKEDCLRLKECGNFTLARRYYEMLCGQSPETRKRWYQTSTATGRATVPYIPQFQPLP